MLEPSGTAPKQAWSAPQVHEYDLKETKGGIINVQFEGPFNVFLGDCGSGFLDPPVCN